MPIGSSYNGNALDAIANAKIDSGDPVIVGTCKGFANASVAATEPLSVSLQGAYLAKVAGDLTQGATVFVLAGTAVAGKAVPVTLTTAEATSGRAVFGFVYALGQGAGEALVVPVQGNGKGASS